MRRLDRASEAELLVDIDAIAATHLRPKLIFMRCLDLLAQRHIQLPSENRLTALIASAMARLKRLTDPAEKQALIDTIGRHALISWRHVNLLGEYDFSDERLRYSFGLRPPRPVA